MTVLKRYLTPREVEAAYAIPYQTLANWRSKKEGPSYTRKGGRIRYAVEALDAWFKSHTLKTYDGGKASGNNQQG